MAKHVQSDKYKPGGKKAPEREEQSATNTKPAAATAECAQRPFTITDIDRAKRLEAELPRLGEKAEA